MQPYFLPYIGYWQLLNEVNVLVVSNDTKYVKQSWINRNRLLIHDKIEYLTIPLKRASDYALIYEREIATTFDADKAIRRIVESYKVERSDNRYELLNGIIKFDDKCLDRFLVNSISRICDYLSIKCEIVLASDLKIPSYLKKEERIFHVGKLLEYHHYVNLPGGRAMYDKANFRKSGLTLSFIEPEFLPYKQQVKGGTFYPGLSVLDLILNLDSCQEIQRYIKSYRKE